MKIAGLRQIRSLDRVMKLATMRRTVSFAGWEKPCPAAFVIGMPMIVVQSFLRRGLYEYKVKLK